MRLRPRTCPQCSLYKSVTMSPIRHSGRRSGQNKKLNCCCIFYYLRQGGGYEIRSVCLSFCLSGILIYCTVELLYGLTDFFVFLCVLFCSFFNRCISVFALLCFFCFVFCALLVILSLLLIMGGQHDGLLFSDKYKTIKHYPPHLYSHVNFSWQINSAAVTVCVQPRAKRYTWIYMKFLPTVGLGPVSR